MNDWVNFAIVIFIQLCFLIFVAYKKKKVGSLRDALLVGGLVGLFFGVAFDLVVGKYLGVYDYFLGFGLFFLSVNGIVSHGLMIATISLLHEDNFFRFYAWTIGLGVVYEVANYFFPVWSWYFADNAVVQAIVLILAAYFGLASLMAIAVRLVTRKKFNFFGFLR